VPAVQNASGTIKIISEDCDNFDPYTMCFGLKCKKSSPVPEDSPCSLCLDC
jgi:hypothetical protein